MDDGADAGDDPEHDTEKGLGELSKAFVVGLRLLCFNTW